MTAWQPGDVLTVWYDRRPLPAWLIRIGGWMRGQRSACDHVVVVHHIDAAGTWWGIEGRPGGVGWVDLATYQHVTSDNAEQPKTPEQRQQVCDTMVGLLGTPYDWAGIVADAMQALRINRLWHLKDWGEGGAAPGHVVCSSVADWVYEHLGLASPRGTAGTRWTTPADWEEFNRRGGWT